MFDTGKTRLVHRERGEDGGRRTKNAADKEVEATGRTAEGLGM
jgi:hypothetical protein